MILKRDVERHLFLYFTKYLFTKLSTQKHTLHLIQISEVWIAHISDIAYRFTRRAHLWSQFLIDIREFIERENRFFDSKSIQFLFKGKILQCIGSKHQFRSDIQIRNLIGLANKWRCSRRSRIRFDDIYFIL